MLTHVDRVKIFDVENENTFMIYFRKPSNTVIRPMIESRENRGASFLVLVVIWSECPKRVVSPFYRKS